MRRVAGAVEDEVESEVGSLKDVGDNERQLEAWSVVVVDDIVAQMQQLGRRHEDQEEDNDRHQCRCQATTLLTSGRAGHHHHFRSGWPRTRWLSIERRSNIDAECVPTHAAPALTASYRTTTWRPEVETGRQPRGLPASSEV